MDKTQPKDIVGSSAHPGVDASMAETLETLMPLLKNLQRGEYPPSQVQSVVAEKQTMPRYQVKGMYGTKAMRMANVLDELTRHYSTERNISQREIFEVALIEFFLKYGYRDEVEDYLMD